MKFTKPVLLLIIVLHIVGFFVFGLDEYFTFEYFQSKRSSFHQFYATNQLLTISLYALCYIFITALSLPGAAIMTLAGGALFGLLTGTVVVSFASTIGATLAFLVSRYLLRDLVQKRFGTRLSAINEGFKKEGTFYLFALRLVPLFPFFVINLVMGLVPIRTAQFFLISQLGMLPGTIAYVYAGTQIGQVSSLKGLMSPQLLIAFAILGLFPLIAKRFVSHFKSRKFTRRYKEPRRFDYNLVVIGAGSGGLVSAYIASTIRARVALIEKHKMGGDCLNTGCVPSKALIRSAKMLSYAARAKQFGFQKTTVEFDFSQVMERVHSIIKRVEPHDSVERYTKLGVECIQGEARIKSPYEVEVNGKTLTTKNIILATGAAPFVPPIEGIDSVEYLTSDTIWNIRELPNRLVVLGGGPIGSELSQCFARFGSKVTQVEMGSTLLSREDADVSTLLMKRFEEEGIQILTHHKAKRIKTDGNRQVLVCDHDGTEKEIEFDKLLVAIGRRANTKGFGLENLEIEVTSRGTIAGNEYLQTNYPNIFVCGDATGPYQFTHSAAHQAWYATVNALFSPLKRFKVDYRVLPWCTFTDPEIAHVGLGEKEAKTKGVAFETTVYGLDDLDRAIADSEDHGFVKVLTPPGSDKILGATIVGSHAGDLLVEFVAAMKHGFGLNKILGTIHTYPTLGEANKYTAGNWKKAHAPEGALRWLERFHRWRRH